MIMQSQGRAMPEHWLAELTWRDSGDCAHTITREALDRHQLLSMMAMAVDVLAELSVILEDEPPTEPPAVGQNLKHLWHFRVRWSADDFDHFHQGWCVTADEAWRGLSAGLENLADIREVLRQVYGPRSPRLLGDDTEWQESLDRYDRKEAESVRNLALTQDQLDAHMATRRPPGTPG
jgi:hypothetical protein